MHHYPVLKGMSRMHEGKEQRHTNGKVLDVRELVIKELKLPVEHLGNVIRRFDLDRDNCVAPEELHMALRRCGLNLSSEQMALLLTGVGMRGLRKIDCDKFCSSMAAWISHTSDADDNRDPNTVSLSSDASDLLRKSLHELLRTLRQVDIEQTGAVTRRELLLALAHLNVVLRTQDQQALLDALSCQTDAYGEPLYEYDRLESVLSKRSHSASEEDEARSAVNQLWQDVVSAIELRQRKLLSSSEMFLHFDRDRDGYITPQEFQRGLHSFGISLSPQQMNRMFIEADGNGDGLLDYQEFSEKIVESSQKLSALAEPTQQRLDQRRREAEVSDQDASIQRQAEENVLEYKKLQIEDHLLDHVIMKLQERSRSNKELFRAFDSNKDGLVDLREFKHGLRKMNVNLTEKESEIVFAQMDTHRYGYIDFQQFAYLMDEHSKPTVSYVASASPARPQEDNILSHNYDINAFNESGKAGAKAAREKHLNSLRGQILDRCIWRIGSLKKGFEQLDTNNDNEIDKQEFKKFVRSFHLNFIHDRDIEDLFDKFDSNGDGFIDFEEFCVLLGRRSDDQEIRKDRGHKANLVTSSLSPKREAAVRPSTAPAKTIDSLQTSTPRQNPYLRTLLDAAERIRQKVSTRYKSVHSFFSSMQDPRQVCTLVPSDRFKPPRSWERLQVRPEQETADNRLPLPLIRTHLQRLMGVDVSSEALDIFLDAVDYQGTGVVDFSDLAKALEGKFVVTERERYSPN
eukprot:GILK01003548.1.p1 GENE.GILK01003548.1~~GILK01003548.1.p1  ORF type:complete len:743 (-),score=147.62 GILK01003548.1:158-2386(-)